VTLLGDVAGHRGDGHGWCWAETRARLEPAEFANDICPLTVPPPRPMAGEQVLPG